MSKLTIDNNLGSTTKMAKIEEFSQSNKSSISHGSILSEHGSKFGRSVAKFPKRNNSYLVKSMSTVNSRVIPTIFNFKIQHNSKLPDLTKTEATDSIRIIGKALNILDYEFNYSSFWLLDVLSKLIKDLQLKNFSFNLQNTFLAWFQFVLRSISVTGSSREEMFDILQEMFKVAVEMIHKGFEIPQPEDIKTNKNVANISKLSENFKNIQNSTSKSSLILSECLKSRKRTSSGSSTHSRNLGTPKRSLSLSRKSSTSDKNISEDRIQMKITLFYQFIEMIYEVFADRFVYNAIARSYSSPSILTPEELNIKFYDPKPMKPEPVLPLPEMTPKTPQSRGKREKNKHKKSRSSSKMSTDMVLKGKKRGQLSVNEKKEEAKRELSNKELDKKISDVKKSERRKKENPDGKEKIEEAKSKPSKKGKDKKTSDVDKSEGRKKGKADGKSNKGEATKNKSAPTKKEKDKEDKKTSNVDKNEGKKIGKSPGKAKSEPVKKVKEGKDKKMRKSSSKSIKSRGSSLIEKGVWDDVERQALKARFQLFERTISPEMEYKKEKDHQFILPLSEAVDNIYIENLLRGLIPPEEKPKELILSEDNERQRKKSKGSNFKTGTKVKTKKK